MAEIYLHPTMSAAQAELVKDATDMQAEITIANNIRLLKVEEARRRHGKPFAHEEGSNWRPRETPLLTEWMGRRVNGNEPEAA